LNASRTALHIILNYYEAMADAALSGNGKHQGWECLIFYFDCTFAESLDVLLLGAIVTDLPGIELHVTVDHIKALAEGKNNLFGLFLSPGFSIKA
jgi:hypothetical protein